MKKQKNPSATRTAVERKSPSPSPTALREADVWLALWRLAEPQGVPSVITKSYVLSTFWAWLSQIEWSPQLRIPVPRCLGTRDP